VLPLLEAFAKVRVEHQSELVIVGRSSHLTQSASDRLGIAHAVRFESAVSRERLVQLFAEAEIAIVPSLYEGFSLPAVEAMACGVPLVATTGGALPEVVGDDGAGLLVPPGDPDALAQAILRLCGDAQLRARMGRRGRERALARFTWRQAARRTNDHYRALLDDTC
jgi:glycosyltransferase involved in cell wall biosynthesis